MTPPDGGAKSKQVMAVIGGFAGAFLMAAPYTLLRLPGFLNWYASSASASVIPLGAKGWIGSFRELLWTMGWPALLLACAGFILAVVRTIRGPGHARFGIVIAFVVAYAYLTAGSAALDRRALLPLLPFACLLAAIAVVSGVSLLRRFDIARTARTALITGGTIAALLPPALRSIGIDHSLPPGPAAAFSVHSNTTR